MAQPPAESALENPFGDPPIDVYQPPDMQSPPEENAAFPPSPVATSGAEAMPLVPTNSLTDLLFADGRKTPSDNRSGAFQRLSFVNTWLPRMGGNGFGWYDAELTTVWGLPLPNKDSPLVITPGIASHWLDGPDSPDIPSQLHDTYVDFRWLPKLGDRFRIDVAVRPGYYSDWDGSSARAWRVTGHLSGIYDWTPQFQLVLGAAYLDRPDIEVLPIAGVIWKPDPSQVYQLVFPTPKVSWRIGSGAIQTYVDPTFRDYESWLYLGGELGGGTWAIRHSDGASDLMSYGDWRIFAGLETKSLVFCNSFLEAGFVFHRLIRLSSTGLDTQVGNTAMVRGGVYF